MRRAARELAAWCPSILLISFLLWFLGFADLIWSSIDAKRCTRGEKESKAGLGPNATFLDSYPLGLASVGYGQVGLHGDMGFESRCVRVAGEAHAHSVGMHPPSFSSAAAEFTLPPSAHSIYVRVAINDGNNIMGRAGSPLKFSLSVKGGRTLWTSNGIQQTGDVQTAFVPCAGAGRLRLIVAASSNACAHAVWVDPIVIHDMRTTFRGTPLVQQESAAAVEGSGGGPQVTNTSRIRRKGGLHRPGKSKPRGSGRHPI